MYVFFIFLSMQLLVQTTFYAEIYHLNTMHKSERKTLNVIQDITCYEAVDKHGVSCERKGCQQWINHPEGRNCIHVTTQQGALTLREIGKIYGLTRMRICQIEKNIYQKIRSSIT